MRGTSPYIQGCIIRLDIAFIKEIRDLERFFLAQIARIVRSFLAGNYITIHESKP